MSTDHDCDDPECDVCRTGMTAEQMYQRIDENVEKHGRHVVYVMPDGNDMPFTYTIGNHCAGLPELIVFGMNAVGSAMTLNEISDRMLKSLRAGSTPDAEALMSLGGKYPVSIRRAQHPDLFTKYVVQAPRYLEWAGWESADQMRVMQVLVPDTRGRFPGQAGCAEPYASVPLLRSN
jgi:hypothetical protein